MATLIEGFEGVPYTSTVAWDDVSGGAATGSRTGTNVTQGSFSWRFQGDTSSTAVGLLSTSSLDLSAYSTLWVDLTAVTTSLDTYYLLTVNDGSDFITVQTANGFTGSTTIQLNLLSNPSVNLAAAFIGIYASTDLIGGTTDFYIDNLRTDAGVSIPVIMNHLRQQGIA